MKSAPRIMSQKPLPLFECLAALFGVAVASVLIALPSSWRTPEPQPADLSQEVRDHLAQLRVGLERYLASGGEASVSGGDLEDQLLEYLVEIPVNPLNGRSTVRVMPAGFSEVRANGTAGWVYLPATATLHVDFNGVDSQGNPYLSY